MDFNADMLKDVVRKVAPTVATALGGPLAGVAVSALSQIILGKPDGTPADLDAAVSSGNLTGEQIVEIRKLDADLKAQEITMKTTFADLEFKTTEAYLGDVQSARGRQIALKDYVPQIILACAAAFYAFEFGFFLFGTMPSDEFTKALVVRGFGTVDGILIMCVQFFVGSSKGSKTASESLQRIAEAPSAPASAPAPTTVIQSNA